MYVSGCSHEVPIYAVSSEVGQFSMPIIFHFTNGMKQMHIVRYLHMKCVDDIVAELTPTTNYKPPPTRVVTNNQANIVDDIVNGIKPDM